MILQYNKSSKFPAQYTSSITRILQIEDSLVDVILFKHILKDYWSGNFELTDTPNLGDAFNLMEEQNYDVIILDLSLLDMKGVAPVAALHARFPQTPIIIYSGSIDESLQHQTLLCGAKKFFIKGRTDANTFMRSIRQLLSKN